LTRYVELYPGSARGRKRLTQTAKWAVNQASINQQDVLATPIPLPDIGRQRLIVAEVDRRLSIVREVEAEVDANLKRAQALRQAERTVNQRIRQQAVGRNGDKRDLHAAFT